MEAISKAKTITGVEFQYTGSLSSGLTIYMRNYTIQISKTIIDLIKSEILSNSPVLMGANRDKPNKYSVGEFLRTNGHSPQNLSYVVPLLIEDGFCKVNTRKPYILTKT